MSGQQTQRVRRMTATSPSAAAAATTKQRPIKAMKPFSYRKQSSPTRNSGRKSSPSSSPTQAWSSSESHRTRTGNPDRRSPGSPSIKVEKPKPMRLSPASLTQRAPSLETAYLHGQWPKDTFHYFNSCAGGHSFVCDKSTQTTEDWDVLGSSDKKKKGHRRSASLGHGDQLQLIRQRLQKSKEGSKQTESSKPRQSPVPGNHSALPSAPLPSTFTVGPKSSLGIAIPNIPKSTMPRYQRNSVEGLNPEVEIVLKSISLADEDDKTTHDIPDGHRAPVPDQPQAISQTGSMRSVDTQTPSGYLEEGSSSGSRSSSVSPAIPIIPGHMDTSRPSSRAESSDSTVRESDKGDSDHVPDSPQPKFLSSPKPDMFSSFAREPPDGCEKVKATCFEEPNKKQPFIKEPLLFCQPLNSHYVLKPSVTSAFNPLCQTPELALRSPVTAGQSTSIEGQ